ncbi:hypothetical protein [Oceanobacillus alkalisoli]|uniref:hypothetical protein n=1 Tax=Oceanobacillus alkalisoli TaxID=2925113 RepID=UPI001EF088A3|nr:hypothetical protein [Oceanobacillus alkalisoli]MCF3944661.1 hypothetical protein [Oceanobacillus alkalisoli]MCG5105230.1 hypothetical protein [Oceanobacillus alkalisoli]
MEEKVVLQEILNALNEHSKQINEKMDKRFLEVDERFNEVNEKIDNLTKKVDGIQINLQETQETAEFAASKVIQHEKKLRHTNTQ